MVYNTGRLFSGATTQTQYSEADCLKILPIYVASFLNSTCTGQHKNPGLHKLFEITVDRLVNLSAIISFINAYITYGVYLTVPITSHYCYITFIPIPSTV